MLRRDRAGVRKLAVGCVEKEALIPKKNCWRAKVVGFIASRVSCELSLTGVKILRGIRREKAQKKQMTVKR